jgi:protein TonB
MKHDINYLENLVLIILFLFVITSANGSKNENQYDSQEMILFDSENTFNQKKETKAINQKVDLNKIYEQSEVEKAVCPFDNRGLIDFLIKNFKYPEDIEVSGSILTDLIIEKDGTISDVIVVKSLHPALDKEAKRVLKLMPNFMPGKINEKPVRSKFRIPVVCNVNKSTNASCKRK